MPRFLCRICRHAQPTSAIVANVLTVYLHCTQGVPGAPYRTKRRCSFASPAPMTNGPTCACAVNCRRAIRSFRPRRTLASEQLLPFGVAVEISRERPFASIRRSRTGYVVAMIEAQGAELAALKQQMAALIRGRAVTAMDGL